MTFVITVCATCVMAAAAFDRWHDSGRCTAAFRKTLIDRPAGLPVMMHEYSYRHLFPATPTWPDPRNIRVTLFSTFTVQLSSVMTWSAALLCAAIMCVESSAMPRTPTEGMDQVFVGPSQAEEICYLGIDGDPR